MLSEFVDALVVSAPEGGISQWNLSMSGGLSRADDGTKSRTFDDRVFAPPAPFNVTSVLAKARNHLNLMLDEINAMQTSPEYMRKQVLNALNCMHFKTGQTSDELWRQVTWDVITAWLNQILRWQDVVAECENLRDNLSDSKKAVSPGAPLSVRANTALKAVGLMVSEELSTTINDLRLKLGTMKTTQDHMRRAAGESIHWHDLDPTKQGDRLAYMSAWLQLESERDVPRPVSDIAGALQMEFAGIACDRDVEVSLCSIALLDEMRLAWGCSQLAGSAGSLTTSIVREDIVSRHQRPGTSREIINHYTTQLFDRYLECGRLLRTFCDHPVPRGCRDAIWLAKMTEWRAHLAKFWQCVRDEWKIRQKGLKEPEDYTSRTLAHLSFDLSDDYLREVQEESQQVHDRVEETKKRKEAKSEELFVTQSWDKAGAIGDGSVQHKRTKAKAVSEATEIQHRAQRLTLGDQREGDIGAEQFANPEAASLPRFPVKQDTLSFFSNVFPTGAGERQGSVRWCQLIQAMTDAGMVYTQSAGSAVTFSNADGSIGLHKPHPEPVFDAIMLREFGRRLRRWFGWRSEMFVLRVKDGEEALIEGAFM